ncbi:unnamed protein product, partial [Allacma fusca]
RIHKNSAAFYVIKKICRLV